MKPSVTLQMTYTIFCILQGDKEPFRVDIDETLTVDHLKEAIHAKIKLPADFLPHRFVLYPINISLAEDLVAAMEKNKPRALWAPLKLSKVFDLRPAEEMIHILVEPHRGESTDS